MGRPTTKRSNDLRAKLILDSEDRHLLDNPGNISPVPQGNSYRFRLRQQNTYLHRFLLKVTGHIQVDHINGKPWDNRKKNLRIISAMENTWNTRAHSDSKYSAYKGVSYWNSAPPRKKRWLCQIMAKGKLHKAYFATEVEAAKHYNKIAKQEHGRFAVFNKIKQVPNFAKDLKRGHSGEEHLLAIVPTLLRTDGIKFDFLTDKGKSVELKYDCTRYAKKNLFLETTSNSNKGTLGGPYRALHDSVDYFVYLFSSGQVFCFSPASLVDFIEQNKAKYEIKTVSNGTYNTLGYAIPANDLKHLDLGLEVLK